LEPIPKKVTLLEIPEERGGVSFLTCLLREVPERSLRLFFSCGVVDLPKGVSLNSLPRGSMESFACSS